MANLGHVFDCRSVEPATGGGNQLPLSDAKGWPVIITGTDIVGVKGKENSAAFILLNLLIIDGEHKGVEGTYRINYFSDNETAARIAKEQLSAVGYVTNVFQLSDTEQLKNIPFRIVVGNQKPNADQAAKMAAGESVVLFTEVKKVLDINGALPGKGQGAPAAAPQAPAAPPSFAPPAAPAQPAPAAAPAAWGGAAPAQPAQPAAPAGGAPAWSQNPAPAAGAAPPWQK